MRKPHLYVVSLACLLLLVTAARAADAPATGEDRLREALKDSMIQLRSAQADLATLQASQAATADEKKALSDKYEALKKQVAADRLASDKSATALGLQLIDEKAANARLKETLDRAKAEGDKFALTARDLDASGGRLKNEKIFLERKVADLEAKNLALFLTGNEILSRYAEFGLGTAISAKEPFVSLTRTKLENLVQDYQDQLLDQRAKP